MPDLTDLGAAPGADQTTTPFSGTDMLARATALLEQAKAAKDPQQRASLFHDAIAALPPTSRYDPATGTIRDTSWWERYGNDVISLAAGFGGIAAAGLILGPANAATLQAGTSAAAGQTGAGGSLSSLSSFGEGGPVGGLVGPETALPVSTSVGTGTEAAVDAGGFGAGSTAGVPEALAPAPLASTPTAAAGAYAPSVAPSGAVPAATSGGGVSLSGVGKTLSNPLIGGLITAGLQYAQSRANANAAQTASQQEIDAANKALALQKEEFDLSRGDYLNRQAYTQQQITGLAPYQDIGTGALANLRSLTGQPSRPGLANTPPVASLPPPVVPSGTLSSLSTNPADNRRPPTAGTPTGTTAIPKMITVRDVATGETQQRPYAELQHWQSVPGAQVTA